MSAICGLWKNLQVLIYSKLHEKNHVITYYKIHEKSEMAYHNYAEARRAHQVQK